MEKVFVKEEVDCEVGVSEAAARAGLYDGHEVKNELVIGPETLQPSKVISTDPESEALSYVKIEPVKTEPESIEDPLKVTDVFVKSVKLVTHMESRETDKTSDTGSLQAHSDTKHYVCDLCSKSFQTKLELMRHLKHERRSDCIACRQHLLCEYDLNSNDDSYEKFSCKFCGRIYKTVRCLLDMERTRVGISYRCKICKHTFKRLNLPYKCDVCKKRFATKSSLKKHIVIHTGEKPYSCKKCKQRFTSLSILKHHQQVHLTVKPFTCDVCHKQFTTKKLMMYHKRFHARDEVFKCEICDKEYLNRNNLFNHLRIHAGVKPHRCDTCGKCFSSKAYLTIHGHAHTTRPYQCQLCPRKFKKEIALEMHKPFHAEHSDGKKANDSEKTSPKLLVTYRRVQKGEMFSCGVCEKQFTKQSSLSQHVQLLHSLIVKNELVIGPETLQPSKVISTDPESEALSYVKIEPVKSEPESIEDPLKETDVCVKSVKLVTHMESRETDKTSDTGSLQAHFDTKHYVCDLCSKSFQTKLKLIRHLKYERRSDCIACSQHLLCEYDPSSNYDSYAKFSCKFCGRKFQTDRYLLDMKRTRVGISYRCKICKHTFKRQNLPYRCDVCKKRFSNKYSLKIHIRIHTDKRPYTCNKCKQGFTTLLLLRRHQQVHVTEKPLTCDVCHKQFCSKYTLIYHKRSHTQKEIFKCGICGRKYTNRFDLVYHQRTHAGRRPYRCDTCGKCFSRKAYLTTHAHTHIARPYQCQLCPKNFKEESAFEMHKLFHGEHSEESSDTCDSKTEKRPPVNSKAIDSETTSPKCMVTYSRVQKGEMLSCGVCGKQFTKQSSLSQHVQLLHSLIVKNEPE